MSYLLHVLPLISLNELTPITDSYQWMHMTIWNRLYVPTESFHCLETWSFDHHSPKGYFLLKSFCARAMCNGKNSKELRLLSP